FDVFFDIRLGSLDGPISLSDDLPLSSDDVAWTRLPTTTGAVEIPGVNVMLNGVDRAADFWPVVPFQEVKPGVAIHVVTDGHIVPGPASAALLVMGVAVLAGLRLRSASRLC